MKDLRLDESGDVDFELTQSTREALQQAIRVRLKTLAGECFLEDRIGVPYYDLLGKKISPAAIAHLIREQIRSIDGVGLVQEIKADLDPKSRKLHIELQVNGEKYEVAHG